MLRLSYCTCTKMSILHKLKCISHTFFYVYKCTSIILNKRYSHCVTHTLPGSMHDLRVVAVIGSVN